MTWHSCSAFCARCAGRRRSWCRAPPACRRWPSPAASPTPSKPRPSRPRGREPRLLDLRLGGRAVGRRACGRRRRSPQAPPPRRPRRSVRRSLPRSRGRRRPRSYGALLRRGVRRGPLEAAGAFSAARSCARRVPGQALRSRGARGLSRLPSARGGGGGGRGDPRALLHRAADVGVGRGPCATARVGDTARRDPPLRRDVLPRARRSGDVRGAAAAGLCKSGTTTLEAALADLPMVVAYRLNPLSNLIATRVLRVPWVGLVNLIAGYEVAPEFLQRAAHPDALAEAVRPLLDPASAAARGWRS